MGKGSDSNANVAEKKEDAYKHNKKKEEEAEDRNNEEPPLKRLGRFLADGLYWSMLADV